MTFLLRSIAGGLIAGAAGTLAMDMLWFVRYKRGGGESSFAAWELPASQLGAGVAAAFWTTCRS